MIEKISARKEWSMYTALALVISLFAWSIGFGLSMRFAQAEGLSSYSDTLSDSDLGMSATHTISFVIPTTTTSGQTIRITFDPLTDRFDGIQNVTSGALTVTGMTLAATCGAPASEVTLSTSTSAGNESIIFTVCGSGDSISSGTKTVVVKYPTLVNPTSSGSYIIRTTAGNADMTDTRIAIIDDVVVTAAVDTSFTFTIYGVSSSITINGVTTTVTSTATTLAFGTLPLNSPVTMGQRLTVATNARNGFVVTVYEDQNLTSFTGADIDLFRNGNATSTPSPWASPSSTLDSENTYGHIGLTSNDSDLNSGEFNGSLFVGNFQVTSSRQVFSHTGPADGTTQDKGMASVAWRIQIGALQEAGNDYTNVLTYVATPTF